MQTVPPPPALVVAPTNVRNQFARCDNTTPLGRPVLPLVKKMTCGSCSSRSVEACRTRVALGDGGRERNAGRACELGARVGVGRPGEQQRRSRILRDRDELLDGRSRVERREHGTDLGERREQWHRLQRRVTPPQHPIASPHTHGAQAAGEALGPGIELAEGEDVVVEGRSNGRRRNARRVREHLADQQHRRSIARSCGTCFSTIIVDSV